MNMPALRRRICPRLLPLAALLLFVGSPVRSQGTPPFILNVSGGLFFPAYTGYRSTFQSSSDLIWSVGGAYPLEQAWYLAGDVAFFSAEAFYSPAMDTSQRLTERLIHFGVMRKEYLGGPFFLRVMGGFNLVSVKYETAGPNSSGVAAEAERKFGYFAGLGIEELLPGANVALCGNVIYDYRRVQQSDLAGDFGGLRLVLGLEFILR